MSELYCYCEHESDANECMEILNVLNKSMLQFHQLNHQIMLLEKTNSQNTRAIAWNVSALSSTRKNDAQTNEATSTPLNETKQNVKKQSKKKQSIDNSKNNNIENKLKEQPRNQRKTPNNKCTPLKSQCWGDLSHDTDFKCTEV